MKIKCFLKKKTFESMNLKTEKRCGTACNNLDVLRIWQASVHLTQLALSLIWYYLPTQTQVPNSVQFHRTRSRVYLF
jgi:hypothetical protein